MAAAGDGQLQSLVSPRCHYAHKVEVRVTQIYVVSSMVFNLLSCEG
jgi:hypothetical protein